MRKSSHISALTPKKGGFGEAGTSRNGTWGKADRWKEWEERWVGERSFLILFNTYTLTHTHTHTTTPSSPLSPAPYPSSSPLELVHIRGPRSAVKNEKEI